MDVGLAERSDRATRPLGAVVVGRDGYDVLRLPDRPGYWFGNRLLLHAAPEPGSLADWRAVWDRELGPHPDLERVLLTAEQQVAEAPPGMATEARNEGLELELDDVLVLDALVAHAPPGGVEVRPLRGAEWHLVTDLHVEHLDGDGDFQRWRMGEFARLLERGSGRWWVAWRNGRPVASAGLFRGDGLSRYANVVTHPAHRRQGIAAALVAAMAASHLAQTPDDPLVIVAERDSSPARLYRRVGFTLAATAFSLIAPVTER